MAHFEAKPHMIPERNTKNIDKVRMLAGPLRSEAIDNVVTWIRHFFFGHICVFTVVRSGSYEHSCTSDLKEVNIIHVTLIFCKSGA